MSFCNSARQQLESITQPSLKESARPDNDLIAENLALFAEFEANDESSELEREFTDRFESLKRREHELEETLQVSQESIDAQQAEMTIQQATLQAQKAELETNIQQEKAEIAIQQAALQAQKAELEANIQQEKAEITAKYQALQGSIDAQNAEFEAKTQQEKAEITAKHQVLQTSIDAQNAEFEAKIQAQQTEITERQAVLQAQQINLEAKIQEKQAELIEQELALQAKQEELDAQEHTLADEQARSKQEQSRLLREEKKVLLHTVQLHFSTRAGQKDLALFKQEQGLREELDTLEKDFESEQEELDAQSERSKQKRLAAYDKKTQQRKQKIDAIKQKQMQRLIQFIISDNNAAVRIRLDAGEDPNYIDPKGISLLEHAEKSSPSIAALLIEYGAANNPRKPSQPLWLTAIESHQALLMLENVTYKPKDAGAKNNGKHTGLYTFTYPDPTQKKQVMFKQGANRGATLAEYISFRLVNLCHPAYTAKFLLGSPSEGGEIYIGSIYEQGENEDAFKIAGRDTRPRGVRTFCPNVIRKIIQYNKNHCPGVLEQLIASAIWVNDKDIHSGNIIRNHRREGFKVNLVTRERLVRIDLGAGLKHLKPDFEPSDIFSWSLSDVRHGGPTQHTHDWDVDGFYSQPTFSKALQQIIDKDISEVEWHIDRAMKEVKASLKFAFPESRAARVLHYKQLAEHLGCSDLTQAVTEEGYPEILQNFLVTTLMARQQSLIKLRDYCKQQQVAPDEPEPDASYVVPSTLPAKLIFKPLLPDGNSLFCAVALHRPLNHIELRQGVAEYLQQYKSKFMPLVVTDLTASDDQTSQFNDYCWTMGFTEAPGGETEIRVLVEMLSSVILVFKDNGTYQRFDGDGQYRGEAIFLYHTSSHHYDALDIEKGYSSKSIIDSLVPHQGRTADRSPRTGGRERLSSLMRR